MRIVMMVWLVVAFCVAGGPSGKVKDDEIRGWVQALSSDEMRGRSQGSVELEKAADWIGEKYREYGLQPLPGQASMFLEFEGKAENGSQVKGRNVVGYLAGSDPERRGEFVLISAHYDHIGTDPKLEGDQIFNGADDNASGVAVMIAIAKQLAASKVAQRSVVFAAWGGEELGLLGSMHFAKHPPLALEKVTANINLEMVGHSDKFGPKRFFMTGPEYSELSEIVKDVAGRRKWAVVEDPYSEAQLFFRSDNVSFAMLSVDREKREAVGIPAHSFSSAAIETYYHKVNDDMEGIDPRNMTGMAEVLAEVVKVLANRAGLVQWLPNEKVKFKRP